MTPGGRTKPPTRPAGRGPGGDQWYLLIHQLPPEPLYLRAKIRQRLARVGAVALKNAVYVLPRSDDCLEDFQWIAEQAISGGGEAFPVPAAVAGERTGEALIGEVQAARRAEHAAAAGAK